MTDALMAHDRTIRLAPHAPALASAAHLTFRHVVVLLDGSPLAERSLAYLRAVARAGAARLTLLQVVQQAARVGSRGFDAVEWEMSRAQGQSYLAAVAARLEAHGMQCRIELAQGATAEQIARFAAHGGVDLLVMTSHGQGGVSPHWARGCTAQKVIAAATTSVLVVPAHAEAPPPHDAVSLRRILLPLDCSRRAECVLPVATALARAHGAELVLAHVVCAPEMPRRMGPSPADAALGREVVERNGREAKRYLREIQNRLASDRVRIQSRLCGGGDRARALRNLAEREAIDLVMLAAHGGTGDAQQRYGSLANGFLQEGYVPVIVVQDFARPAEARH